jgi:hypothetical protein
LIRIFNDLLIFMASRWTAASNTFSVYLLNIRPILFFATPRGHWPSTPND